MGEKDGTLMGYGSRDRRQFMALPISIMPGPGVATKLGTLVPPSEYLPGNDVVATTAP
jgi:hypothetical protein